MKLLSRCLLISLLSILLSGCWRSNSQQAYDTAVAGLESRISRIMQQKSEERFDKTDPMVRVQQEFVLPSDQATLEQLKTVGAKALRRPQVLWGVIRPSIGTRRGYFLDLEWLDTNVEASGFFLETSDNTIVRCANAIDLDSEELKMQAVDSNPCRYGAFGFSQMGTMEAETVPLTKQQYQEIIEQRKAQRVGLILTDGTLTEAGPLAYQENFETP